MEVGRVSYCRWLRPLTECNGGFDPADSVAQEIKHKRGSRLLKRVKTSAGEVLKEATARSKRGTRNGSLI